MKIENRRTLERMWAEADVQEEAAGKATTHVESLTAAESTAAAQVRQAEAALAEAQAALVAVRTDLTEWQGRLADASTECRDLRAMVRAACTDMDWPLPGMSADNGGQVRTGADEPGPARTVADPSGPRADAVPLLLPRPPHIDSPQTETRTNVLADRTRGDVRGERNEEGK